ncbi:serine/threonine protein kinase [Fonticula alba]|uniref:Serine/threonine protein kinase n=1 Tax=Fonticula alba TaxID=691883 RepID=A0A058Z1F9_FONAL|nr:serine/threonine protein kinase [Fonticula alba]KCV67773.1 serine/threonine protein kinase [Fonticula alba]|eukprot:XP_009497804.1 serine/threonine protein kinase [Fonticula alba]
MATTAARIGGPGSRVLLVLMLAAAALLAAIALPTRVHALDILPTVMFQGRGFFDMPEEYLQLEALPVSFTESGKIDYHSPAFYYLQKGVLYRMSDKGLHEPLHFLGEHLRHVSMVYSEKHQRLGLALLTHTLAGDESASPWASVKEHITEQLVIFNYALVLPRALEHLPYRVALVGHGDGSFQALHYLPAEVDCSDLNTLRLGHVANVQLESGALPLAAVVHASKSSSVVMVHDPLAIEKREVQSLNGLDFVDPHASLVSGDFNGDGHADLLVLDSNRLMMLLGPEWREPMRLQLPREPCPDMWTPLPEEPWQEGAHRDDDLVFPLATQLATFRLPQHSFDEVLLVHGDAVSVLGLQSMTEPPHFGLHTMRGCPLDSTRPPRMPLSCEEVPEKKEPVHQGVVRILPFERERQIVFIDSPGMVPIDRTRPIRLDLIPVPMEELCPFTFNHYCDCAEGRLSVRFACDTCAPGFYDRYVISPELAAFPWPECDRCTSPGCASCQPGQLRGDPELCFSCIEPYALYNDSCLATCPQGMYNLRGICTRCPKPCTQCDGSRCLACADGLLPQDRECVAECSRGYTLNVKTKMCVQCTLPCLECSGQPDNCLSCRDNYLLQEGRCVSTCSSGYMPEGGKRCVRCDGNCLECREIRQFCIACQTGLLLQDGTCVDTCSPGYFRLDGNCLPCDATCAQCAGARSTCTDCPVGRLLEGSRCVSACSAGRFASDGKCLPCNASCTTCSGSAGACTGCPAGQYLQGSTCVAACSAGHFQSGTSCLACDSSCKTCSGSATACTACPTGRYLQGSACVAACSAGYFQSGTSCLPCDAACATCVTSAGNCTSCPAGRTHFQSGSSCLACNASCATCSGSATACTACPTGRYLQGSACVTACASTHFQSGSNCLPCSSNCATCATSASNCTSCPSGQLLEAGQCVSACSSTHFASGTSCLACGSSCATCVTSADNCTSCPSGRYLQGSACVASCSAGYFQSGSSCLACSSACKTCAGSATACTACPNGRYLQGSACVSACASNRFLSGSECLPCSNNCATCATSAGNCTSCPSGQYLQGGACVSDCADGHCATCTGSATTCTGCPSSRYLQGGSCVAACSAGYFLNGSNCLACSSACKTCAGSATACTSCPAGQYLQGSACVTACASTHFQSGSSCLPCDANCKTCSGSAGNCTGCPSGEYLQGGACVAACSAGFYANGSNCLPCNASCATCSGSAGNCTACPSGQYLQGGACVASCASTHFQSGTSCLPCSSNCATCATSAGNCTSCPSGQLLEAGQCVSACSSTHFASGTSCLLCSSACKTCAGSATACTACPTDRYLQGSACVSACASTHFVSGANCLPCSSACKTCSGSAGNCTSCPSGQYLQGGACVSDCADGQFSNGTACTCSGSAGNCTACPAGQLLEVARCVAACSGGFFPSEGQCLPCDLAHCATCATGRQTCTGCPAGRLLQGTTCVASCSAGYFAGASGRDCLPCDDTCGQCAGPGAAECTSCRAPLLLKAGQCVGACSDGFFPSAGHCLACDASCATCAGPSAASCLACPAGRVLHGGQCLDACPAGWNPGTGPHAGQCVACAGSCATCVGPTSEDCTDCPAGRLLVPAAEGALAGRCAPCRAPCRTCATTVDHCTGCPDGYALFFGACMAACPGGYVPSAPDPATGQRTCMACHETCLTCDGPGARECTSCATGQWLDRATGTCRPCAANCRTCETASQCSSCQAGRLALGGACLDACPAAGYYTAGSECRPCHPSCGQCSGPGASECTSCQQPGTELLQGRCDFRCPEARQFRHPETGQCQACDAACGRCIGPTDHDCWDCSGGRLLEEGTCRADCSVGFYLAPGTGVCQRCSLDGCEMCSGPNSCQRCRAGLRLMAGRCELVCGLGFRPDEGTRTCVPCPANCRDCSDTDAGACTRCNVSFFRAPAAMAGGQEVCLRGCPAGHFASPFTLQCEPCAEGCAVCSGPNPGDCFECQAGLLRMSDGVRAGCVAACPAASFAFGTECFACHADCAQCGAFAQCTSCAGARWLQHGRCVDRCSEGWVGLAAGAPAATATATATATADGGGGGGGTCVSCLSGCRACAGSPSTCTVCLGDGLLHRGACVATCPEGSFQEHSPSRCTDCAAGCTACLGPGAQCTRCAEGLYLQEGMCVATCREGLFPVLDRHPGDGPSSVAGPGPSGSGSGSGPGADGLLVCRACPAGCRACACDDPGTCCLSCPAGRLLLDGTCLSACPSTGFWTDAKRGECHACGPQCERCEPSPSAAGDKLACSRCASGFLVLPASGQCVGACPTGTFADLSTDSCSGCHEHCVACTGPLVSDCTLLSEEGERAARGRSTTLALAVTIPLVLIILIAIVLLLVCLRRRASAKGAPAAVDDLDKTVLNTAIEIALPGFLLLTPDVDLRLGDHVGKGGQGSIVQATLLRPDLVASLGTDKLAVKLVLHDAPSMRSLFESEISIMWALNGAPNVVQLVGYANAPQMIAMRLYDTCLKELLRAEIPLSPEQQLAIATGIAAGLAAIHQRNIGHRDIKPGNVMMSLDPGTGLWTPYVGDFGVSMPLDQQSSVLLAQEHFNAFSAAFASPEIWIASQAHSVLATEVLLPSDVYAFTVLLWSLFTKAVPWETEPQGTIASHIIAGQRPCISTLEGSLQSAGFSVAAITELVALMSAGWSQDPLDRPTAEEMRLALAAMQP